MASLRGDGPQGSKAVSLDIPFAGRDTRRLSTESLRPLHSQDHPGKRRLLLIYIHGFLGDERSFQSFPAHVHNVVTALLSASHVVHSKIYPRYRSKHNIIVARDAFTQWLSPHEADTTDVILLGHSMGGLVAAEVALMLQQSPRMLKHRILGTVNFDVPFLGMHPRVIKSGIQSIFQSSEKESEMSGSEQSSMTAPPEIALTQPEASTSQGFSFMAFLRDVDETFNPAFENDVNLPKRKGWEKVLHFVGKHSNDLFSGTKNLVNAHIEFGGAMADYKGLKARYVKIRSLESESHAARRSAFENSFLPPRVRFVNYYTASTGRPKRKPSISGEVDERASMSHTVDKEPTKVEDKEDHEFAHDENIKSEASAATSKVGKPKESDILTIVDALPVEDSDAGRSSSRASAEFNDSLMSTDGHRTPEVKKDRKFCALPPKDAKDNRDPTWVRVFMKDMDEVAAHCGLFFPTSPAYSSLVSEVAEHIREWIQNAESERVVKEMTVRNMTDVELG